MTTPVIIPRRRSNQRATVDRVTTSWVLKPMPMNSAYTANSCQGAFTSPISAYPSPNSSPDKVNTQRGPNRSLSRPAATASKPITKKAADVLADNRVRDQPSSASRWVKNTP